MSQNPKKPKLAISVGDVNGVGVEIILKSHKEISSLCEPIYCAHKALFLKALKHLKNTQDFETLVSKNMRFSPPHNARIPQVSPSTLQKASGKYSFASFMHGLDLVDTSKADAVVTLPIQKAAWKKAGLHYAGHTQVLRHRYKKDAIMMLGCEEMLVALFTEHIPLKSVSASISIDKYVSFLIALYRSFNFEEALVLGFNPHCGDSGAIGGKEDKKIQSAIKKANKFFKKEIFYGIVPPDSAFTPANRARFSLFIAPYHDIGLATLKALYFEKSINVSLNLPIIRTSVDHGVAYDIAYKGVASTQSYKNAVAFAIKMINEKQHIKDKISKVSLRTQIPNHTPHHTPNDAPNHT